jgi:hypothetical protein
MNQLHYYGRDIPERVPMELDSLLLPGRRVTFPLPHSAALTESGGGIALNWGGQESGWISPPLRLIDAAQV